MLGKSPDVFVNDMYAYKYCNNDVYLAGSLRDLSLFIGGVEQCKSVLAKLPILASFQNQESPAHE